MIVHRSKKPKPEPVVKQEKAEKVDKGKKAPSKESAATAATTTSAPTPATASKILKEATDALKERSKEKEKEKEKEKDKDANHTQRRPSVPDSRNSSVSTSKTAKEKESADRDDEAGTKRKRVAEPATPHQDPILSQPKRYVLAHIKTIPVTCFEELVVVP